MSKKCRPEIGVLQMRNDTTYPNFGISAEGEYVKIEWFQKVKCSCVEILMTRHEARMLARRIGQFLEETKL